MAGGGGGPSEPGFLDIPTYVTSLILAFFLLISVAFERGTHWLIHALKKRKRNGLAQAVSNLVTEITLVGLVSLLLIVLQSQITSICVPYSAGPYAKWNLISNVHGCDCCFEHTKNISPCVLEDRQCGPAFCNCNAQNATCVVKDYTLEDALLGALDSSQCTCTDEQWEALLHSPEVAAGQKLLSVECDGMIRINSEECGEGKAPLITYAALHQIHIFIFVVALTHVVMGIIMIVVATWRLRYWRKQCPDEDDEHTQAVRRLLDQGAADSPGGSSRFGHLLHKVGSRIRGSHASRTPASPAVGNKDAAGAGSGLSIVVAQPGSPGVSAGGHGGPAAAAAAAAAVTEEAAAETAAAVAGKAGEDGSSPEVLLKNSSSGSQSAGDLLKGETTADEAGGQGQAAAAAAEVAAGAASAAAAPDAGKGEVQAVPARASSKLPGAAGSKAFLSRSHSIKRDDYGGWLREYLTCLLLQFLPTPVSSSDLRLMRASFILTHRVPKGFDFWSYITQSMEDDFAQIVGVSAEMWITLVVFVLISGLIGWAALIGLVLAALMLVVVNVKIMSILRYVSRGCRANQLSSNVFWFKRPALLLHPIKYILFLCSLLFASVIFFVWEYGSKSCPFTARNNDFWFAWALPWWTVLIFSAAIFIHNAVTTLPFYSLAVQMGSEFKHHMLPSGVKQRLLLISERIKQKAKAQRAAAEAGRRGAKTAAALQAWRQ